MLHRHSWAASRQAMRVEVALIASMAEMDRPVRNPSRVPSPDHVFLTRRLICRRGGGLLGREDLGPCLLLADSQILHARELGLVLLQPPVCLFRLRANLRLAGLGDTCTDLPRDLACNRSSLRARQVAVQRSTVRTYAAKHLRCRGTSAQQQADCDDTRRAGEDAATTGCEEDLDHRALITTSPQVNAHACAPVCKAISLAPNVNQVNRSTQQCRAGSEKISSAMPQHSSHLGQASATPAAH